MQKTKVKVPIVFLLFFFGGGAIDLDLQGQILLKSKFTPFWACLHHNSLPIQARITKLGQDVQNSLF